MTELHDNNQIMSLASWNWVSDYELMTTTNHTFALRFPKHTQSRRSMFRGLRRLSFERTTQEPFSSPSDQVLRDLPPVRSLQR